MSDLQHSSRDVSCRNLGILFDICDDLNEDRNTLLINVPYSAEHICDPSQFIDWESCNTLFENLNRFMTRDEILAAARKSMHGRRFDWVRPALRTLFDLGEIFDLGFRPETGAFAQIVWCMNFDVVHLSPTRCRLSMTLKNPSHVPSPTFNLFVEGQVIEGPVMRGDAPAEVTATPLDNGVEFDVTFTSGRGILAWLRRALVFPFTARMASRELVRMNQSLQSSYYELEQALAEREKAEGDSRLSEGLYRILAENMTDTVWAVDMDLRFTYMSPSVERFLGHTIDEAMSLGLEGLVSRETFDHIQMMFQESMELIRQGMVDASRSRRLIVESIHQDGHLVPTEIVLDAIHDEQGHVVGILGVSRDITERMNSELTLRESEARFRTLVDHAQEAIVIYDISGDRFTEVNGNMVELFGYDRDELMDMGYMDISPETQEDGESSRERGDAYIERALGGEIPEFDWTHQKKDGETVLCRVRLVKLPSDSGLWLRGSILDISEQRASEENQQRLEQQLQQSQKMESIGLLAGGVAHDFNNLLVAIMGYTDLSLNSLDKPEEQSQYLTEIKSASERAAALTRQLLSFSRRQVVNFEPLNLNRLIEEMQSMLDRLIPENIRQHFSHDDDLAAILADSGQLEQVTVNMAVNARDAMPEGGCLEIETSNVVLDEEFVNFNPGARTGDFVRMRFQDDGVGMDEEIQQHVYEPFFTTKDNSGGTGLGLAVVYGIVEKHKGFILLNSAPGDGACFDIYFPVAVEEVSQEEPPTPEHVRGGAETILLAEDEPQVRRLSAHILENAGYNVVEACDGQEAVDIYGARRQDIDVILMDVIMPRMGGRQAMEQIHEIDPEAPIIFASGYSNMELHTDFILDQGLTLIQKPYTSDVLLDRVRKVLDREPS